MLKVGCEVWGKMSEKSLSGFLSDWDPRWRPDFGRIPRDDGNFEIHKMKTFLELAQFCRMGILFQTRFHEKLSGMNQGEIGAEKIQKSYSLGDRWAEFIQFSFKIIFVEKGAQLQRLECDVRKG